MQSGENGERWRDELDEILGVCEQRARLPLTMPHCAICARYATDNLPFEALMSLLDVMPTTMQAEAVSMAKDRLAFLPPPMRQQQVSAVTLPALMDSPGWPLVRCLVIDMADQSICQHFDDPRLAEIEEITLLGFAYDECNLETAFSDALFHSRVLTKVRTLKLHSVSGDADLSRRFWSSPLARRLEQIAGVPYYGEPFSGQLAAREIKLSSLGDLSAGLSLSGLLDPATTPQLTHLRMSAYLQLPTFLQLLESERRLLERIDDVSLSMWGSSGEQTKVLRSAQLPESVSSVSWRFQPNDVSRINVRGSCDMHTLYDFANEQVDIRSGDQVTDYDALVFDWHLREEVSRQITDLNLLLPLELDIAELIEFCSALPRLKKLSLIHPMDETLLETLLAAEPIRHLEGLSLYLSLEGGQWDVGSEKNGGRCNEYMQTNESAYRSKLSAKYLFDLAFGPLTETIHNLTIAAPSFEVTRSPTRIQHCSLESSEAVRAFVDCGSRQPIEELHFDSDLTIDESLAKHLTGSDVLGRVYRLNLRTHYDEKAARVLADCEDLRTVRAIRIWSFHHSVEALRAILDSPHLSGAWDVDLSLPDARKLPEIDDLCAGSRLLERAVSLGISGPTKSAKVPGSGRLGRVRQLHESLGMNVLGDARLAKVWGAHPIGLPLKVRLADVVQRTYQVQHPPESLPELQQHLDKTSPFHEEGDFVLALQAVLATAFQGEPVPEDTPYTALNEFQQEALRGIAKLDDDFWNVGGLMHFAMLSYGFNFWDKERFEAYIAGTEPD